MCMRGLHAPSSGGVFEIIKGLLGVDIKGLLVLNRRACNQHIKKEIRIIDQNGHMILWLNDGFVCLILLFYIYKQLGVGRAILKSTFFLLFFYINFITYSLLSCSKIFYSVSPKTMQEFQNLIQND